jgi:hypothetical protein
MRPSTWCCRSPSTASATSRPTPPATPSRCSTAWGRTARLDQPGINCSSSWFTSTPELAAASGNAGQVIIGDGTLADLTCWTTEGTAAPAGITAHIFLLRAGAIVDTGMSCPLTGNDYIKNQSSATFPALDGDRAIVTASKPAGDVWVNLNVVFDKQ